MVRFTSTILFALLASTSALEEESASMLQVRNRHDHIIDMKSELTQHELTKRQGDSAANDQVLSQLEKSLSGKKDNTYKEKSPGQTCYCPLTSSWRKSCCSEADNKGMNTGDFCGNYRKKLSCNTTEAPVCCNTRAGDAVCCKAGASCSAGCLNGGATNPDTGVSMGVCGCIDPPPESEASRTYDEDMATAMAELSSAAGCSAHNNVRTQDISKIYKRYTCQECHVAGFELEEGTVHTVIEHDFDDNDALFAFVARATSVQDGSTVQTGDCILSVRGTKNGANWKRNFAMNFRDHEEPEQQAFEEAGACEGCGIHSGYSQIYHALKPAVVTALESLGCGANSSQPVYATGHSMGAAVASLFMYDLQNNGFNMALSYTFESPRMGNQVFAENFRTAFGRKVPMFRITNKRDLVVHFPLKRKNGLGGGYTHVGAEVYYGPTWDGEPDAEYRYTICSQDDMEDVRCANRYNLLDSLKAPGPDHTQIPLLGGGSFDWDQDWCKAVKDECISDGRWICAN